MNLSWLEISKSAILNNVAQIRKNLKPQTKFIAVVKANAYGHGILEVSSIIKNKIDHFAVYDFDDALLLRKNKITKPILVLGRIFPAQIKSAITNDIEVSVSNFDILEAASKLGRKEKLKIHICVDSGLGRDGFLRKDFTQITNLLHSKRLEIVGLYTHFSAPDNSEFDDYTKKQTAELLWWKTQFRKIGFNPLIHASSTSGSFIKKFECEFDAVRIGGGLYGLWASDEVEKNNCKKTPLKSVLSWKAKIIEVKEKPKGSYISYGCTHQLKHNAKIAILPVGYFDGIPRVASNQAHVLINGIKVPQLGRVTMNMIILDVTNVKNVKVGDVATIIGSEQKNKIEAADWGNWSQSFNYEITTRINHQTTRKITK